ncbi:TetR/AcrR family transcriptional regulator [Microbacterium hominis]|uniref:TetR/AcrR family transcriptional regulator n=1 Tax=Microbacterium hominis TaxID=162426 RepID=UPI0020B7B3E7|nr:TetR/AcrR family transcriptional regulator [Microbacterium hominis]
MPTPPSPRTRPTRERIMAAAVDLADRDGIDALTIRALAKEMGVGPMTLYHYVEGKEQVLDGMVDVVFEKIALPDPARPWRDAVRARCASAREVLVRHPWSVPLLESRRSPGPATLRHHEAMLACFLEAGLSMPLTAHAYAVLDAYVYGFAIQEASLLVQGGEGSAETAAEVSEGFSPESHPHLVRFTTEHAMRPDYRFGDSFAYGLDLVLDGLEAAAGDEAAGVGVA